VGERLFRVDVLMHQRHCWHVTTFKDVFQEILMLTLRCEIFLNEWRSEHSLEA